MFRGVANLQRQLQHLESVRDCRQSLVSPATHTATAVQNTHAIFSRIFLNIGLHVSIRGYTLKPKYVSGYDGNTHLSGYH
jgi:hypothetical protein